MAVTNNIREIREQRGIYQDDLASAIGYSTKTVGFFTVINTLTFTSSKDKMNDFVIGYGRR